MMIALDQTGKALVQKRRQDNSGGTTQFSGGKAVDLKGKVAIVTGDGTGHQKRIDFKVLVDIVSFQ